MATDMYGLVFCPLYVLAVFGGGTVPAPAYHRLGEARQLSPCVLKNFLNYMACKSLVIVNVKLRTKKVVLMWFIPVKHPSFALLQFSNAFLSFFFLYFIIFCYSSVLRFIFSCFWYYLHTLLLTFFQFYLQAFTVITIIFSLLFGSKLRPLLWVGQSVASHRDCSDSLLDQIHYPVGVPSLSIVRQVSRSLGYN